MENRIMLAGKSIKVDSLYFPLETQYPLYSDKSKEPDIDIPIKEEDIYYEDDEMVEDNSLLNLERFAIHRKIAEAMLEYSTFLMHGSVIATDKDHAYMFTAPSKTGKSTHTKLWLDNLPSSFVVNGDKPLLKVESNQVLACGTPWCGKEGWNTNCMVPLKGIVILERDDNNSIEEIPFIEAFPNILIQTYRPNDSEKMKKILSLLKEMSKSIKFYKMKMNNYKEDAFITSYNALTAL